MIRTKWVLSRVGVVAVLPIGLCSFACDRKDDANEGKRDETQVSAKAEQSPTPVNPPPNTPTPTPVPAATVPAADEAQATAELKAADGEKVEVEAKFYATADGVRVVAEIEDAKPGKHGFHVHETGDCSDIKGKSMGSHFSPAKHEHALPTEAGTKHLGDLGNVEVSEKGDGRVEITVPGANLQPNDPNSFLGKALVFHMGEDTGKKSQPAGGSGDPIACGVIEKT